LAEGSIKRLTEKGFGFISTSHGNDLFFHSSALVGVTFEELRVGQRVEFTAGESARGPRAESIRLLSNE
jgi:CspA family cold shock protein